MRKLFTLALTFVCICSINAQTALPYFTGFDNVASQSGWTQYRTGSTANGAWSYVSMQAFTTPSCMYHGYPVGGSSVTIDWFVSPAFNFPAGGTIDSVRYNFSGFGMPNTNDTVAIFLLNGSQTPSLATKTLLFDFRGAEYNNDNVWRKKTNLSIPASAGQSYIAIKYVTTVNWLDVRFDNIALSGISGVGLNSNTNSESLVIFPNPVNTELSIALPPGAYDSPTLDIYDINGCLVERFALQAETTLRFEHPAGIYFYKFYNKDNSFLKTGKLVKK
jgi:hypothetical protein